MSRVFRLGPGLVDAGLSSLAGFAVSLYAVRYLEGSELGAFAIYLSASLVGGLMAQHLVYLPAQIVAVRAPREQRPAMLPYTLRAGPLMSIAVAPFVAAAGVIVSADVAGQALLALGGGAALMTVLVPAQDHVRSTLYLAARHERGALVSAGQFAVTVPALAVLHGLDVPTYWVPFTAISLGSGASMLMGLLLARSDVPVQSPVSMSLRYLMRSGRPLLPAALIQEATILASGAILVGLTSAATLGLAEAARIVSRPVQALSLGVSRSLAPRLMEAGQARSSLDARSAFLLYTGVVGAAGLGYLLLAGWSYPLSPFAELLPSAYEKDGLVALFILASLLGAIAQIPRAVLLGANQGKTILFITVFTSALRLAAVAAFATAAGAYALPLAHLASLLAAGWMGARFTNTLLKSPGRLR